MALPDWRMKGTGLLELVGTVLRDDDTEACMYLIGNRQYNAERSRQKEDAGKRKGKGKGGREGDSNSGSGPCRKWNISCADATWGGGRGKGKG